jgi:glycerophosphoryl diester phosphodiesterase
VEFDVMLSSDRIPVLMHDDLLTRTATSAFAGLTVASLTSKELSNVDVGSYFKPSHSIADLSNLTISDLCSTKPTPDVLIPNIPNPSSCSEETKTQTKTSNPTLPDLSDLNPSSSSDGFEETKTSTPRAAELHTFNPTLPDLSDLHIHPIPPIHPTKPTRRAAKIHSFIRTPPSPPTLPTLSTVTNHTSDLLIPTFEEVLKHCLENKVFMNIEIKPTPGYEMRTGVVVGEMVMKYAERLKQAGITLNLYTYMHIY